jgi:hypothetical protein
MATNRLAVSLYLPAPCPLCAAVAAGLRAGRISACALRVRTTCLGECECAIMAANSAGVCVVGDRHEPPPPPVPVPDAGLPDDEYGGYIRAHLLLGAGTPSYEDALRQPAAALLNRPDLKAVVDTLLGSGDQRISASRAVGRVLAMRLDLTRCGGVLLHNASGGVVLPRSLCPLFILLAALDFMCLKLPTENTTDRVGMRGLKAHLSQFVYAKGKGHGSIQDSAVACVLRKLSHPGAASMHSKRSAQAEGEGAADVGGDASDASSDDAVCDGDTLAWLLYAADAELRRVEANPLLANYLPLVPEAWVRLNPTTADLTDFYQGKRASIILPRNRAVLLLKALVGLERA